MTDVEWMLIGILIGIPIGMLLLWLLTHSQSLSTGKTFSNLEEWEFIRDPETGRTKGLRVRRTAKEGA